MSRLVGISGVARSGKDTLCQIIKNFYLNSETVVKRYAFADALKEDVKDFLLKKCEVDVWTDDTEIKKDIRDFLVWYGTSFWRKRKPNIWVDIIKKQIKIDSHVDIAIVTDCRYPNEAEWILNNNGELIHVDALVVGENGHLEYLSAPNEEEAKNDPILKTMATYKLVWPHFKLPQDQAVNNNTLISLVKKYGLDKLHEKN